MTNEPPPTVHFTDLGFWKGQPNCDEFGYTLALMNALVAEAKTRWPEIVVTLPPVGTDLWTHATSIVGYFEYSVDWWNAKWPCGEGLVIEMRLYYGYRYESDGTDSITASLKGLPDGKSAWAVADFNGNVRFEWSR